MSAKPLDHTMTPRGYIVRAVARYATCVTVAGLLVLACGFTGWVR